MGRIVVEVMPKPEILDPQGKAVVRSLPRLGFEQFTGVRQGRRFELTVDGPVTEEHLAAAREAADILCEALDCECVQVIGRKFVLFKQKKKESAYTAVLAK